MSESICAKLEPMTKRHQAPLSDSYLTPEEARQAADPSRVRGLSDLRLKIIGYIFIVIGLIGSSMLIPALGSNLRKASISDMSFALLFEAVSWCALPIFAWLTLDSVRHTSHLGRYALRLLALALVSEVPYDMSTTGRVWDSGSQSPVWAVLICVVVLWIFRYYDTRRDWAAWAVRVLTVLAAALDMVLFHIFVRQTLMQGGLLLLGFVMIFHVLDSHENTMMLAGVVWGMGGLLPPSIGMVFLHYRNGRLGYRGNRRGGRVRAAFYIGYPAMLLAFGLIRLTLAM